MTSSVRRLVPGEPSKVLVFQAYFKESVHESPLENYRIRKCDIFYYTEDSSIQILEKKMENSGVPQGNFLKRHQVPRGGSVGGGGGADVIGLEDLVIGATVTIYSRTFHIIDANSTTKEYLRANGFAVGESQPFPVDRYEAVRSTITSRETGKDPAVCHNIKKNPMKEFAEAMLGQTVNNKGREGFLKYERKVLRFHCVWDNRQSLYGDLQFFKLHYFMMDDTVEVLTVNGPNAGRDPYPLLLRRGRLPKDLKDDKAGHYHWRDMNIGSTVNVYCRELTIIDADASTRQFFEHEGRPLAPPMHMEQEEPPKMEREIPPYTGFGSEEDSLTSCTGSLVQTAPRKVLGENKVLRFLSSFHRAQPEDEGREFIISYFLVDKTLGIHEPPKRNSGIIGGSFLARGPAKQSNGQPVLPHQLYLGATLTLSGRVFLLRDTDEPTLQYMEEHPNAFPLSDARVVLGKISELLAGRSVDRATMENLCLAESSGPNSITPAELHRAFGSVELVPPKQYFVTLTRALGQDGKISIRELLSEVFA